MLLATAGCGDAAATHGNAGCERVAAGFSPELRETECPVKAAGSGKTTCGVLRVAEDPDVESCALDIAWAQYEPKSAAPRNPPLFLLGGGPGGPLLEHMEELVALGEAVAPGHVLVAHDARGAGLSTPTLDCMDTEIRPDSADLWSWEHACAEYVVDQGHHPERYRTPVLADDVVALADALSMPTIDVLGASYGSRLAHLVATAHPDRVRAVVLDAATPLDTPLLERMAGNFRRAWQRVVEDCSAQSTCDRAHGDLQAKLDAILETLAKAPVLVMTSSGEAEVDATLFVNLLGGVLTNHTLLPSAPALVAAVASGDMKPLKALLSATSRTPGALYMHHAIMCSEELPHNSRKRAVADLASFPQITYALPYDALRDTCDALGLASEEAEADLSATPPITQPTLALTGRYDTQSPASNWDRVDQRLPRGTLWDIGDAGHGGRKTPCGEATVAAFLRDPSEPTWPTCLSEVQAATFLVDLDSLE